MMPAGLSLGSEFALHLYEVLIWFVWLPGILMAGSAAGRRWHRTWAVVAVSLMLLPLLGASAHLQTIEGSGMAHGEFSWWRMCELGVPASLWLATRRRHTVRGERRKPWRSELAVAGGGAVLCAAALVMLGLLHRPEASSQVGFWVSAILAAAWLVLGIDWWGWSNAHQAPAQRVLSCGAWAYMVVAILGWWGETDPSAKTATDAWILVGRPLAAGWVSMGILLRVLLLSVRWWNRENLKDPVTGALNRLGFEERARRSVALAGLLHQSVSVVLMEIDAHAHLRRQHGQRVSQDILQTLAHVVERIKRDTDVFARLAGQQFIVVLPGTDVPGAKVFAERLRNHFSHAEIELPSGTWISTTVSLGIAYASPSQLRAGERDLLDLLRQADEALDRARRSGGNRVRVHESIRIDPLRMDSSGGLASDLSLD